MKTRIKMKQENKLSWKQKAARIAASVVLPFTGFLATKTARGNESNGLSADFNNDGIVDVSDMEAFSDAWLATEGQTTGIPVSGCRRLDIAGESYVSINDVIVTNYGPQRASCFTFSAEDINLDFNGHTILGSNPQSHHPEVLVSDNNGITIKNMTISHGSGIGLTEIFNSTLENINSNTNQYGVYTYDISNCKFENIETHSNSLDGIVISGEQNILNNIKSNNNGIGGGYLFGSNRNVLTEIVTNENGWNGLDITQSSANLFNSIHSNNNINTGIDVLMSSGNTFDDVEVNNNGQYGVRFEDSPNNIIKDGRFNNPNAIDMYLKGDSHDVIFMDCHYNTELVENGSSLIRAYSYNALVTDSSEVPVANAKVYGNRADGELEFMVRTGADGKVNLPLIDYINDFGVKKEFAPYTITAEKGDISTSHIYDPNGFNSEDTFILGE